MNDAPDWTFETEEISAGWYRIRGKDKAGRSVERHGDDPEILMEECKKDAREISRDTNNTSPS